MTNESKLDARLALVDEHIRAENEHDLDAIMATFGPDPKFQLNAILLDGGENIRAMYNGFGFGGNGSFSDVTATETARHIADKSVVVELLLSGKHTADFQGIPATNREFKIPACAIFDFADDETLAGERVYFDGALMMQQLGVLS